MSLAHCSSALVSTLGGIEADGGDLMCSATTPVTAVPAVLQTTALNSHPEDPDGSTDNRSSYQLEEIIQHNIARDPLTASRPHRIFDLRATTPPDITHARIAASSLKRNTSVRRLNA